MVLALVVFTAGGSWQIKRKHKLVWHRNMGGKEHTIYNGMKKRLDCQDHLLSGHPGCPWDCMCPFLCSYGELSAIYVPMKAQAKTKCCLTLFKFHLSISFLSLVIFQSLFNHFTRQTKIYNHGGIIFSSEIGRDSWSLRLQGSLTIATHTFHPQALESVLLCLVLNSTLLDSIYKWDDDTFIILSILRIYCFLAQCSPGSRMPIKSWQDDSACKDTATKPEEMSSISKS